MSGGQRQQGSPVTSTPPLQQKGKKTAQVGYFQFCEHRSTIYVDLSIHPSIQKPTQRSTIMAEDRERSRSPDPASGPTRDDGPTETNGGSAPAGGDGGAEADGIKLYVGNLDYATDEQKLREEFSQFGTITDVFLPVERGTQRPRGFGFVTFATRADAESAISKMDQSQVDGRTIRVNESRPKGSKAPGGAGFNAAGKDTVSGSLCCLL